MEILTGRVLHFTADPFLHGPEAARIDEAVVIEGGIIRAVGSAGALRAAYPHCVDASTLLRRTGSGA
ncbi:hypothetical protein [Falsirhodobacter sp. alg1]|uniref:imidazolonepropionase-like domain-containing protein n=1 Tax=Falsirhodobacter sp. alg1 TaxID=1472418 RepID=UPI0005F08D71|nr:hypothetical protein [Falsirhodobacter sp. alg1]